MIDDTIEPKSMFKLTTPITTQEPKLSLSTSARSIFEPHQDHANQCNDFLTEFEEFFG
jgi:hypothetical protein